MKRLMGFILCSTLFLVGCQETSNEESQKEQLTPEKLDESLNEKEEQDWELYNRDITVSTLESRADRSLLLQEMETNYFRLKPLQEKNSVTIVVDDTQKKQEFYGYGAALTHASAEVIAKSAQKDEILTALFSPNEGIGLSVIRLCIGASDFVGKVYGKQYHYTYNDLKPGETDLALNKFSIKPDEENIIPLLKQILEINPNIKIVAAPWSAPAWMKTSGKVEGGRLKDEYLDVYANYLFKFIEAYKMHGITIDYLSVQNEPQHETTGYPTMKMSADQQRELISTYLGPMLMEAGVKTKIMAWDHNYADVSENIKEEDIAKFGISLLEDEDADPYISGIAFHGYEANGLADFSKAFDKVHGKYPNTELYFTEISGGDWSKDFAANFKWNMHNIIVGLPNHHAQMILLWNLALDELDGPHLGGCGNCRGVYTTSLDNQSAKKEVEYYALGQVSSKVHATERGNPFVIQVQSSDNSIDATGFVMPDGEIIVTVFNQGKQSKIANLTWDELSLRYKLLPGAAVTFSWDKN